jgi:lipopolysaccharide/colanic/teichoic acid biosynthesis glycosyltransferase
MMDVFVNPSYREGFGIANLEASAMELPVVATRIPGCVDSVEDGVTGTLIPPRDSKTLAQAIGAYLDDPALRAKHGAAGKLRAIRGFQPRAIWQELEHEYRRALATKRRPEIVAKPVGMLAGRIAKRALDISLASVMLLVLAPLMLIVALVIALRMGRPVLFRQSRPGRHGKPFTMFKFRTMTSVVDRDGRLLDDGNRLTPLGRFLRRTSLDELPELFNVLWGDMSLVGPRPLLMQYLSRYTAEQYRRHEVLPGLTGWAQIHGRNQVGWNERLALDVWYVDHRSLWLDLTILFRTIGLVLSRRGIRAEGSDTMPEFMGSNSTMVEPYNPR